MSASRSPSKRSLAATERPGGSGDVATQHATATCYNQPVLYCGAAPGVSGGPVCGRRDNGVHKRRKETTFNEQHVRFSFLSTTARDTHNRHHSIVVSQTPTTFSRSFVLYSFLARGFHHSDRLFGFNILLIIVRLDWNRLCRGAGSMAGRPRTSDASANNLARNEVSFRNIFVFTHFRALHHSQARYVGEPTAYGQCT